MEAIAHPKALFARLPATAPLAAARRLASDEREALAELYDLLAARVYGLALWIARDPDEAADIVQETFLRVWTKRRLVARARDPESYVLRIARSRAIDRKRRERPEEPLADLVVPIAATAERSADASRLAGLVARLPKAQRAVVYLRCYADLSFRQIGRVTGVPTFTAASRYRLAISRLKAWLER